MTIYTIILLNSVCLSQLANCRSRFWLDRLGRCLKLFVSTDSTSCHKFASQFGLAIFYSRKTPKTIANIASHTRLLIRMTHRPAIYGQRNRRKEGVSSSWLGAYRPMEQRQRGWWRRWVGGMCVCVHASVCVCVCVCVHTCVPSPVPG